MEIQPPLFWHQGLFLQPQHFQLLERSFDSRLTPFHQLLAPHFWGISNLEIKEAALALKSFGILQGTFLFPDGTYVEFPGNAVIEDRSFDETWIDSGKPLPVYVGLKKWNPSQENVTVVKKGASLADITTRFISDSDPAEIKDLHAGGPVGHVKKLEYLIKVFWGTEKSQLGDYALIPVAQIERNGADIRLAPHFVPPCVCLRGSDILVKLVKEIGDQLLARSRQLEEHKGQRGIHRAEFGSKDMVYLLALRSINRSLPLLRHYGDVPEIHPWHIYGILKQVIGDLSCFSEKINVLGEDQDNGLRELLAYDPLSLWDCFTSAQKLILRLLDEITAGPDHVIPLNSVDGLYTADLKPLIFTGNSRYYIALKTNQEPKLAITAMGQVAKLSSRQQLRLLISHSLPGIPVEHMSVPPQELPRRGNVIYFSVDSQTDQWTHVKKEQNLALSWDGAPEDLQVDLMVVTR